MKIGAVKAVVFSPTDNTKIIANRLAEEIAGRLKVPFETTDWTLPKYRQDHYQFAEDDLVIFGMPVFAGKTPNLFKDFVQQGFSGAGPVVPVVTFGGRAYDSALAELASLLTADGFKVTGAGAFCMPHVFSDTLSADRPDERDYSLIAGLADSVVSNLQIDKVLPAASIPGDPEAAYYTPLGLDGKPAKFLKAKPKTDTDRCVDCKICTTICPLGSIDVNDVTQIPGRCMKCQACVRNCPTDAKYFDDPAFLSHVAMLEKKFTRRAESEIFV